jgi:monoamine oxidase
LVLAKDAAIDGHAGHAIITASVRQLVTLFGPDAGAARATLFKDWAADALTATDEDWTAGAHPLADDRGWVDGEWRDRISLAGSETSLDHRQKQRARVHSTAWDVDRFLTNH